jgi:hypothetical protein
MKILKQNQYNQSVSTYKLLSSTSGVGSIVPTRHGTYVLISDMNKWRFIVWANTQLESIRTTCGNPSEIYVRAKEVISRRGLAFVDDERFVAFLKKEMEVPNLVCLVGIPHMALNEAWNSPKWKEHPIKKALELSKENGFAREYMIDGSHFPKWFISSTGELKTLGEWKRIWIEECRIHPGRIGSDNFAPPRDPRGFIKESKSKNEDGAFETVREYRTLQQTNLVLICKNGHLSDIPWARYLRWRTERIKGNPHADFGEKLFEQDNCCTNPDLRWSEDRTKSDGYGSIYIHCETCGMGNGGKDKSDSINYPRVSLEGINTLKPECKGERPWQITEGDRGGVIIPHEACLQMQKEGKRQKEHMMVRLATANNVYFANGFSSLFIPMHLALERSKEMTEAIDILDKRYRTYNETRPMGREAYWAEKVNFEDFLIDNGFTNEKVGDKETFRGTLKDGFLALQQSVPDDRDMQAEYRWQEYHTFSRLDRFPGVGDEVSGLAFNDIELPDELSRYFKKIQRVEELSITNVQMDFTRVNPRERIVVKGEVKENTKGQRIFSIPETNVHVLPANESKGEGLFFQLSDKAISVWMESSESMIKEHYKRIFSAPPDQNTQGAGLKMAIFNNGYKHFLIHTFSHMMMRELEFSCGYPTASLKERLYISEDPSKPMSGVLIYTAEGSEGSMGGLVSQGDPIRLSDILTRGLERMLHCSSDPLCWESEGQGVFGLNLSSCFSCSLVAETACEGMNLGLDRRVLVDDVFGYFKDMLQ